MQQTFTVGAWNIDPQTGEIAQSDTTATLEPKLMALLVYLAREPGRVRAKTEIEAEVWAQVVVGEDTVARSISRLRRALGDSAQAPNIIQTLPKRGYRLIAPVTFSDQQQSPAPAGWQLKALLAAVLIVIATGLFIAFGASPPATELPGDMQTGRANDAYMRFTRSDNEAAIVLYERALALDPNNAKAQAGLANALVQRVIRWPHTPQSSKVGASTLANALDRGLTQTPAAQEILSRASAMAERAVRLAPDDPDALKSLAFTHTAKGELDLAQATYERAIALDGDAWASMINLGEIYTMKQDPRSALAAFERAYAAMARAYAWEPQRVGPWQAALGVVIGDRYEALSQTEDAEIWYRQVLDLSPLEPEATARLAALLRRSGDAAQASRLCRALLEKVGAYDGCLVSEP